MTNSPTYSQKQHRHRPVVLASRSVYVRSKSQNALPNPRFEMAAYKPRKGLACVLCGRERCVLFVTIVEQTVCTECVDWMINHPPVGYTPVEMEHMVLFAVEHPRIHMT